MGRGRHGCHHRRSRAGLVLLNLRDPNRDPIQPDAFRSRVEWVILFWLAEICFRLFRSRRIDL
jgi:hypothetical protein